MALYHNDTGFHELLGLGADQLDEDDTFFDTVGDQGEKSLLGRV